MNSNNPLATGKSVAGLTARRKSRCCRILALIAFISVAPAADAQENISTSPLFNEESRQLTARALDWLAARQRQDGSFGSTTPYAQSVGVTALCGMAFLCSGSVPEAGPYDQNVTRCLDYILSCSQSNGYLVDAGTTSHGPMYGHGFATMFLAEVYGMSSRADVRDVLKRAVNLIIATQNQQGGWRYNPVPEEADISVTVCQVMALRGARNAGIAVPKEVIDRAVAYIKKCQNPDGGFRYRLFDPAESLVPRSAAALVALYTAGIHDEPVMQRGFEYLAGQQRLGVTRQYFYYSCYYTVQAYWHSGEPDWSEQYPMMRDQLIERAERNHWKDNVVGDEYATAMSLIALQIPLNLVPIFER